MFRMELASHCNDAGSCYRLLTICTQRATFGMVVLLTIWKAIVIKEAHIAKWSLAVLDKKKKKKEENKSEKKKTQKKQT